MTFTPAFDSGACFNIMSAIGQNALHGVPLKIILGMFKALFKHTLCKFLSTKNSVYSSNFKFKTILLENLYA